jgi:hypothetical protein
MQMFKVFDKYSLDEIIEAYWQAWKNAPQIISLEEWIFHAQWDEEFADYLDNRFEDTDVEMEFYP